MRHLCFFLAFTLSLVFTSVHGSQSRRYTNVVREANDNGTSTNKDTRDYCFQFTWLANMNNDTFQPYVNKSCADRYNSFKPRPLCVDPMIVTDNGQEPDMDWLYQNKFKSVRCTLYDGYTCAKYSSIFNGKVQNVTRYCTKITVNELEMSTGCVSSSSGSHETKVCGCKGMIGGVVPCNSAPSTTLASTLVLSLLAIFYYLR